MANHLHVDIETFSSVDITTCGSYKYFESMDFEILMIAYALDNEPIQIVDLNEEAFPEALKQLLLNPTIRKHAHNANFERNAFKAYGIDVPIEQWVCSAVKSAYCGLPLSLDGVSKALNLGNLGKSAEGKALIKYFSCPVAPTKTNGMRTRNYPHHNPEKWEAFKAYCVQDVEAERTITNRLAKYKFPESEKLNYILDQKINDRGILIDMTLAANAVAFDEINVSTLSARAKEITGLLNPNSPPQLKKWLADKLKIEAVTSLTKDSVPQLIELAEKANAPEVVELLEIRQKMSKTSIKKYVAMLNGACEDNRVRGIHQFYGANRTGRWAGRMVQPQNMPQNKIDYLEEARSVVRAWDFDSTLMLYGNDVSKILSQLTRTAIIAKPGHTFAVADFSAIEARVIAWLSGEQWRLKVFATHGKIYEASASKMFSVPIESVTKDSHYRAKGKVAELALGYQGAVGALKTMGGEAMGLSESEMTIIVNRWRLANPAIVALWGDLESCAMQAITQRKKVVSIHRGLEFDCDGEVMTIKLPSGRQLFYQSPGFTTYKWDKKSIRYKGMDQTTKQWTYVDTYGGKIVENVVQAIARDLLADSMLRIEDEGYQVVMHVHDEAVIELDQSSSISEDRHLHNICSIMAEEVSWAKGLPLGAEGYVTPFYKKD